MEFTFIFTPQVAYIDSNEHDVVDILQEKGPE